MRRFAKVRLPACVGWRAIVVGPSTSIPQTSAVPQFGKRAKAAAAAADQRASASRTFDDSTEAEAAARRICEEKYDFLERPICVTSWREFLWGLQRLELRWTLAPGPGGVLLLQIYDHGEPGDGLLCELKGSQNRCSPIADFFDGCGQIVQGTTFKHDIHFADGNSVNHLRLEAKHSLTSPDVPPPQKNIMCIPQYDCRGTQVDISIIDENSGLRTPLFHSIPLQVLNFHFLTSIPLFLKRNDIGVKNNDFVSKQQMEHFRFAWCFLRRESWMTPVEMGELDNLLPP